MSVISASVNDVIATGERPVFNLILHLQKGIQDDGIICILLLN